MRRMLTALTAATFVAGLSFAPAAQGDSAAQGDAAPAWAPLPTGAGRSWAAAPPGPTPADGGVNLSTLTIDTVDATGGPAFGVLIQLLNVDDGSLFSLTTGIGISPAKYSVPDGHYS